MIDPSLSAGLPPELAQLAASIAASPEALAELDALLAAGYSPEQAIAFVATLVRPDLGADPSDTVIGQGADPADAIEPAAAVAPFGPTPVASRQLLNR